MKFVYLIGIFVISLLLFGCLNSGTTGTLTTQNKVYVCPDGKEVSNSTSCSQCKNETKTIYVCSNGTQTSDLYGCPLQELQDSSSLTLQQKVENCKKLSAWDIDECIISLAFEQGNPTICQDVDYNSIENCVIAIAVKENKPGYCRLLQNSYNCDNTFK